MSTDELSERLAVIAEELADLALDCLRRASEDVSGDREPDPRLLSEERRLTRARRAVEKAVSLLAPHPGS